MAIETVALDYSQSQSLHASPRGKLLRGLLSVLATVGILAAANAARAAPAIAFYNESDPDKGYKIEGKDPVVIATVKLEVQQPSLVLVQFSGHVTTEDNLGCPCSVRASVKADDGKPQPVKRVNLGAPGVVDVLKYEHDRQGVDGSYVFEVAPGQHSFQLIMQQQSGDSKTIELFYPNFQAIAFNK